MESIYKKNITDLQSQLQDAYKKIDQLNAIKDASKRVIKAHTELHEYAQYNPRLSVQLDNTIWELTTVINSSVVDR